MRLYDDTNRIKGGNDRVQPRFSEWTLLGHGWWAQTASDEAARSIWEYDNGSVRNGGGGNWAEKNTTDSWRFKETNRTADYVELYDSSRGYWLRLYKDASFIKGGNDRVQAKFNDWTKIGTGRWAVRR